MDKRFSTLSSDRDGLFGAITNRAEAQCIRLALIYALLDEADAIDELHLLAALAVWEYCEATARYVFGETLGDSAADTIRVALEAAGNDGLNRTAISKLFGRHQQSERIDQALALLQRRGFATDRRDATEGRTAQVWTATAVAKKAKYAKEEVSA